MPQKLSPERISQPSEEELKVYNESFAKAFRLMIKQTFFLTDILLQDLNGSYLQLSGKLAQALDQFQEKLVAYFDSGIMLVPYDEQLMGYTRTISGNEVFLY